MIETRHFVWEVRAPNGDLHSWGVNAEVKLVGCGTGLRLYSAFRGRNRRGLWLEDAGMRRVSWGFLQAQTEPERKVGAHTLLTVDLADWYSFANPTALLLERPAIGSLLSLNELSSQIGELEGRPALAALYEMARRLFTNPETELEDMRKAGVGKPVEVIAPSREEIAESAMRDIKETARRKAQEAREHQARLAAEAEAQLNEFINLSEMEDFGTWS